MTGTIHWLTPSVSVIDSRGLAIRQVEYLRKVAVGPLETVITRQHYDVAGRLIAQWDPRLFGSAPRPNLATVHGLSGQPIKVDSVDAGWRLSLAGVAGEILQRWDERGNWWRTTYDDLLRVLTVDENAQTNVEIFTYARADAAPGNNLRGQLCKKVDPAGSIEFNRFSVQGLPLEETRTFPDGNIYTTAWSYGASGQALSQTDAGGHQQRSRYDIASQLKQVTLQIDADGPVLDILEDAQYNAAGQIIEQLADNGVLSTWIYDPADGRLENLKAGVPGQPPRQDFEYLYDRVGNVLRIDDHTFQPVFFANQRIDGHREFTYDSLYRLTSATGHDATPPSDLPGRPLPSDPRNHLNYTQRYEYDTGGNLIELTHERDVGGYTHQMCIDPSSNRGVRWKEGDPVPDFLRLFDPHGNLQALQPGQDLHWNNRDQLASVTLVKRDDTANDEETYHYSNDVRVSKRHETHTSSTTHFHQVIYLPGLEIRTRDNGEELHVITAPGGRGSVRCLHWVSGQLDDIEPDQLRYSLDDHLGSSLIELDQQARLISHEGYYPFGGTAWLTADSALEVSYKTVRYSGKEMDVSGLYYYGFRYYAPWLQRWVSADPAGDVDGLNLYAFVGSNPLNYFDDNGRERTPSQLKSQIVNGFKFLVEVDYQMRVMDQQLQDLSTPSRFRMNVLKHTVYQAGSAAVGFFSAFHGTSEAANMLPEFNVLSSAPMNSIWGMTLGNQIADKSVGIYQTLLSPLGFNRPIITDINEIDPDTMKEKVGLTTGSTGRPFLQRPSINQVLRDLNDLVFKVLGGHIPGVGESIELAQVSRHATRAEEGLLVSELREYKTTLNQLQEATLKVAKSTQDAFEQLGITEFYDESNHMADYLIDMGLGRVGTSKARTVKMSNLQTFTDQAMNSITRTQSQLFRYRHSVKTKQAQG